jgi:cytochrome c oxidase subunit II
MGKFFAIVVALIAIGSAIPIVLHVWTPPPDISTHGAAIDDQMSETMIEAGFSFLAAQLVLAFFVWKFAGPREGPIRSLPGGAKLLVAAALVLVGSEVLALGVIGKQVWANLYFTPAKPNAMQIQAQAGQFAFYFRYPGVDRKFGSIHPELSNEGEGNFFGLDPENDISARDDVVSAELVIPVNKEIHLLMHAKDVGHSFYVRELRIQQDFVPGLDLGIHFTATKPGKYEIVCTQLCGLGHYNMKAYLRVVTQPEFDSWMKEQQQYL